MGDTDSHVRNQSLENLTDGRQFLNLVVKEENLSSTVEFVVDDALYLILVEEDYFSLCGNPVRGRGVDDRKIPCTQKRKLESPRNRCRSQRQHIHVFLHLLDLFLVGHAKALLLVNDQKTQILK